MICRLRRNQINKYDPCKTVDVFSLGELKNIFDSKYETKLYDTITDLLNTRFIDEKSGYNGGDIEILTNKIKFVIISNTSDGTRENLNNINKFEKGGLSGKPIEEKSNLLINEFYKKFKNKIKIIGVGGIDSGKSAYEKFISGASYIQLYTGMVYQGPNIVNKISEELYEILNSKGVKNIEEIIGSK